jgi:glycosyltransferase involved in cell wall biosynthesis
MNLVPTSIGSQDDLATGHHLRQNTHMRISVIIPALNESASIGAVLASLPRSLVDEILVVDGGSQDGTSEIAQAAGAQVLHEARRGYGRACATGTAHAGGDIFVFMDADGADDPRFLPELIQPILGGQADLVLGSRLRGNLPIDAMPWHQWFGNWLCAYFIRLLYHRPLTDLSPYRAVQRNRLVELELQDMTYGYPTEMIVKAARNDWRIVEVPVTYRPRLGGKSKISGTLRGTFLATYAILRTIWRYSRGVQG